MELRHLRYFLAVAEELHFGRAARRLHLSQPPLSQQIKSLEEELGTPLFLRTRRHVELTDAGRALVPEARATLQQATRAAGAARDAGRGLTGRLIVGFVTSASFSILPGAVRRFRSDWPGVEVTLREMIPHEQLAALQRREIDVGLLRPPIADDGVKVEVVLEEPLVAALPADGAAARRRGLALRHLADEPFALFPRSHGPGLHDVVVQACREAGFVPRVTQEPNEMQAVLACVAAGLAVSLVPASLRGFHAEDVAYRPLAGMRGCVGLALATCAERESAVVAHFLDACRERARADRRTMRR